MNTPAKSPASEPVGFFERFVLPLLSRSATHVLLGMAILLLDLFTGRFLMFPILFVVPVASSAWFCSPRLAYSLAFLLPVGRFIIATFLDVPSPFPFIVANGFVRIVLLGFIAFLVSRTARQTKELQQHVKTLVTMCAWSRTIEYQGEWISFEQYLERRFNIKTSHGISPAEVQKALGNLKRNDRDA